MRPAGVCRTSGIIPACAGSTWMIAVPDDRVRDHPRMCGEHLAHMVCVLSDLGSSPHVRGALLQRQWLDIRAGIIPACAGSTHMDNDLNNMGRDHPRMCGEHGTKCWRRRTAQGSSPHVRGARALLTFVAISTGIIPACAGSTSSISSLTCGSRDHPRMCGEHQ